MAEQKVRWPQDATQLTKAEITPDTPLMAADSADEEKLSYITHQQLADSITEIIEINGIEVKPIPGGATEETAVILPAGPAGENRKMVGVTGWFKNSTGPAWEAKEGFDNTNWWDGSTWSLGSELELPKVPIAQVLDPEDTDEAISGKGTSDYLKANYLDNVKAGIKSYNIGDNIAEDLYNKDFSDTTVWARGVLLPDGSIPIPWTQYHTVKYYPVVIGDYICNNQLGSNNMSNLLYDEDFNIVDAYTLKPNADWPMRVNKKGYVRFSVLESQEALHHYCKTQQAYSGSLEDSDIVTKRFASENLLSKDDSNKIKEILPPKMFYKPSRKMNYSAFVDLKLTSGSEKALRDSNGALLDFFITYIRVYGVDGTGSNITNIIQIAKRDPITGVVTMNQNVVASRSIQGDIRDKNGYITVDLAPINNSTLYFSIVIDTTKLRAGVDTVSNLADSLQLDSVYLMINRKLNYVSNNPENGMETGDSLTEFKTIPELIGKNLGIPFLNVGVGGTRMSYHEDATYGALSFYKIAEAINSGDFTAVVNAINTIIPNVSAARQRRLERTRDNLINTDYSKLTMMTVWFGTNDFTVPLVPGESTPPPIGAIDITNIDVMTIVGAMNYGIQLILAVYPQIRIDFITPTFRYFGTQNIDDYVNPIGLKIIDVVDGIKKMAALHHLPCYDMYRNSRFNKFNHSIYYEDTTHFNDAGAIVAANDITSHLKSTYLLNS